MLQRKRARCAALLAIAVGCGLLAVSQPAQASALADLPDQTNNLGLPAAVPFDAKDAPAAKPRAEGPFGLRETAPVSGSLPAMWRSAAQRLPGEHSILERCRADSAKCPPAAGRFLALINRAQSRDGWTRVAEINRAINLDVRPVSDTTLYGAAPFWPTPLITFASNAGDCKDYAIAKYVALRELGFSADDLRIVVVYIPATAEYHALTAVRYDDHWSILDNRTSEIRRDADISDYRALFVMDGDNVRRMTAPPPTQSARAQPNKPAAAPKPTQFAGPESFPVVL
jgi:predicted transglutaminase-like cysteine proteinase